LSQGGFESTFQVASGGQPGAADRRFTRKTKEKIMTAKDVMSSLFKALDSGDYITASGLLDRDFKFTGPAPTAMNAQDFINWERALRTAFPDIRHNAVIRGEKEGSRANGEVRLTGTHEGKVDVRWVAPVAATMKKISLPASKWQARINNGKIVSLSAEVPPDGGLIGMLLQIGRKDLADCLRTPGADCRGLPETWESLYP
jgi:ketosteroid isomerase-like protein